ncbi:MAG: hypothetical protein SF052_14465 [Bacteroidia bacterium]|nr:hypothetical protein [Bacteroidia bacterium]
MKKLLFVLPLFVPIFLATTCQIDENCPENAHNGLTIRNESDARIRYNFYWNYPDTTIGEWDVSREGTAGLSSGEEFTRGAGLGSCWESVLIDGKKEWVYIFNADTIESLDWEVVRQTGRGLIERREIDLEYLSKNDFIITVQ